MKKLISILAGFAVLFVLLIGCKKEANLTTLQAVTFNTDLTASKSLLVLDESDSSNAVITFNWPEVSYPVKAPVTYTLQISTPLDTIGTTPWSNAVNLEIGDDILSKSLQGKELSKIAQDLGLKPEESGTLIFRVQSYLDRNAYSGSVSVNVTPYSFFSGFPSLWVPGDFQGWNPAAGPKLVSLKSNMLYEGYIYIPAGGTNQFKFTAQPAWEPMAYGDGGAGKLIEANYDGSNFTAPSEGYYNLTADLNTMKYTVTKTTWSIIGDATPGGWDKDTQMVYDPASKLWTLTVAMKSSGSYKFRANNAWVIDFGIDSSGKLIYADHPVLGNTPNLSNLSITEDGNYTITLDLSDPADYKYKLKKN